MTGTVAENFGLTELTSVTWTAHGSSLGTVTPKTVVPGTDCPLPGNACDTAAALDTAREAAEGEAFQPTGNWTLTDVYDGGPAYTGRHQLAASNFGELGVAAESSKALIAPTELFDVQTQATEVANRKKWNDAHRIIVDDGSSTNYSTTANTGIAVPVDDVDLRPAGRCGHHLPRPHDPDQRLQPVAAAAEQPGRGPAVGHPAAAAADPGGQRGSAGRRR